MLKRKGTLYQIPGLPIIKYAGLGSIIKGYLYGTEEEKSAIHKHFEEGTWFIEYQLSRLTSLLSALPIYHHLFVQINHIKQLPKSIVPDLTLKLIILLYKNIKHYLFTNLYQNSSFLTENDEFCELLAVASTQF